MDGFDFVKQINNAIRKSTSEYAANNFTDTTVQIDSIDGQYYTGTTASGKTIRGISSSEQFEIGQFMSVQMSNGNWIGRGSGVNKFA